MRYFTKELWSKINSKDEEIRRQGEEEWQANSMTYQQEFNAIKKNFPQAFVRDYFERNQLHDYTIIAINITQNKYKHCCELRLTNGRETLSFTLLDLKAIHIDLESFQHCILGQLSWGYSELGLTDKNTVTLMVLCDLQNEMNFEFKSLSLTKEI